MGSKKQQTGSIRSAFGGTDEYCRTPEQPFWLLISGFENEQKKDAPIFVLVALPKTEAP